MQHTPRAYAADWADFLTWCGRVSEDPLPALPVTVARYLAQLADNGLKTATIQRRTASIRSVHKAAGFEPPTNAEGVRAVMRGIRRRLGKRQARAAPATAELLTQALDRLTDSLPGLRNRALLLVGFAAAPRRSELVALQVEGVTWRRRGILLHVRRSKTDQEGEGADIPIPRGSKLQPVAALSAWLAASGIAEGPIFREIDRHGGVGKVALSDRTVAQIVKQVTRAAGLDASAFSGHSLRAGFVTSALDAGEAPLKVMKQSRHAKIDTLKIYDRRENGFEDHAGEEFL